jgi:hypothetical protein
MTQLPTALNVTIPLEIEQILEEPAEILIATVKDEDDVAVGVYAPPTTGEAGDVEVREIV